MADDSLKQILGTQTGTLFGGQSGQERAALDTAAAEIPFTDLTFKAFDTFTAVAGMVDEADRQRFKPDPTFDINSEDNWNVYKDRVETRHWAELQAVRSPEEAEELIGDIDRAKRDSEDISRSGYSGTLASIVGATLDVDAFLTVGSGGLYSSTKLTTLAAKIGSRTKSAAQFAQAGAASGFTIEGLNVAVRPESDWQQIPMGTIGGLVLGGALGGAVGKNLANDVNATVAQVERTFDETATTVANAMDDAGAARNVTAPDGGEELFTKPLINEETGEILGEQPATIEDIIQSTSNWKEDSDWLKVVNDNKGNPLSKAVQKSVAKAPLLRTDFDVLADHESSVMNWISGNLLESASGRYRKNNTAAITQDTYQRRMATHSEDLTPAYKAWAKSQGKSMLDTEWHAKGKEEFGLLVREEMMSRRLDETSVTADLNVIRAADSLEKMNKEALAIMKGRDGELSVKGAEHIDSKRGYVRQQWNGRVIRQKIAELGSGGKKRLTRALGVRVRRSFEGMDNRTSEAISNAIITRAMQKDSQVDSSMTAMINADGQETLRNMLSETGIAEQEIERIVKTVIPKDEQAGQAAFTKRRLEIDLRGEEDGIPLMGLLDNDIELVTAQYIRQVSGSAALARQGIRSVNDKRRLIDAAMKEQENLSTTGTIKNTVDREYLEDVFTYFDAGPIAGGLSEGARNLKAVANLSLLGQLGIPQAAELGAGMAAAGIQNWVHTAPEAIKSLFKGKRTDDVKDLMDDLEFMVGNIGKDHQIFRDDLALDLIRSDIGEQNQLQHTISKALLKGSRLMGFTSGFYAMRTAGQRTAVAGMANQLFKAIRRGEVQADPRLPDLDPAGALAARFDDIGIEPWARVQLKKLVDDGTVVFDEKGFVDRLNADQWDPVLMDHVSFAMNRATHQNVQKGLAGESSMWMHKGVGAFLSHLKQFPLMAVHKQAARSLRVNDGLFTMTLMYGLGTAAVAYGVREAINGKTENLNAKQIALGAFSMSNITGFMPMFTDPLAALLGQDQLVMNQYGPRSGIQFLGLPPVLSVADRLAGVPQAVVKAVVPGEAMELSNNDIRSLQTIPFFGKMAGISAALEAMKD